MIYFNSLRKPIPWALVVKKTRPIIPLPGPRNRVVECKQLRWLANTSPRDAEPSYPLIRIRW